MWNVATCVSVVTACLLLAANNLAAQDPDTGQATTEGQTEDALTITFLSTPDDAVRAAAADLQGLQQAAEAAGAVNFDTTVYRYIWVPDANPEDLALVSFVLNSVVSRSDINYTPNKPDSPIQFVADNKLVRVNLSILCPLDGGADLLEVQEVWDQMFNPYFLLEKQVASRPTKKKTVTKKVEVEPYVAQDGETYDYKFEKVDVPVEEQLFAAQQVFGPHVDVEAGSSLQTMAASHNPVVWCHTLYHQALTAADGGLYYDFMGLRDLPARLGKKELSDQAAWLSSLGVSEELIGNVRADQRVGMVRSDITAKPRRIDIFNRPSRSSNNQGIISITQDMFDADYNVKSDPLLNLLEFEMKGREVVFERNNGHLGYILYDGEGTLANEAPPQLVTDHTIPAPHTARLQPGISCIRCHGVGEDEGWKPFENHVQQMLSGFLNVYNDKQGAAQHLTVPETLQTLARLYAGDLQKPIRRAREDHTAAIVRCTAGVVTDEDGQPWDFNQVSRALAKRFRYYEYTPVTPLKACREMGYEVSDAEAAVTLINRLLGFLEKDASTNMTPEDVRMGLLKLNLPINRFQWELIYIDAMTRANVNSQLLEKDQQ